MQEKYNPCLPYKVLLNNSKLVMKATAAAFTGQKVQSQVVKLRVKGFVSENNLMLKKTDFHILLKYPGLVHT